MNVFELYASIILDKDDYEQGLGEAGKKTSEFSQKLKSGLATAAKIGTAAITAAAAGITVLTKSAIEEYGEYEQLVGGVETLFKNSAGIVQQYAADAFQTAGLSANDYMNTVTSFSASLLQSLDGDTAAAAEKANLAITDMSDNANKMGTDMASIQNAYQGFAKQNYTMLDNLKLGYGGTKQEMERLLEDAQKLSGVKYDISSYSDIVDAIHVVQTEMGITGTTALEASTTIEGSVNSAKKAWENWVTGIGNSNADMAQLTGNLLSSVTTAADNILPVISTVFDSIGEVIDTQGEEIISTGISFISGSVPGLLTAGITLVGDVAKGISSNLPALIGSITAVIEENLPTLLAAGGDLLFGIVTGIVENLPSILDAGLNILGELTAGIDEGIPDMMNKLPEIIDGFLNFITGNLPSILAKGTDILTNLITGIMNGIPALVANLPQIITSFVEFITQNLPTILASGVDILVSVVAGILAAIPTLVESLPKLVEAVVEGLDALGAEFANAGKAVVNRFKQGISDAWASFCTWFEGLWSGLFGNRNVNVSVNGSNNTGGTKNSHKNGLDYVPYDNYAAYLHKGEAVLTASEASLWRNGTARNGGGTVVNQYINAVPQTPVELAAATAAYFEQARWTI